jgi:hypothetical protein
MGDAAQLAGLGTADLETAMAALVSAGVVEPGGTAGFTHPILRAAIHGDLSPAERERLHHAAAAILRERGRPPARSRRRSCTPSRPATRARGIAGTPPATAHPGRRSRRSRLLSRALDRPR